MRAVAAELKPKPVPAPEDIESLVSRIGELDEQWDDTFDNCDSGQTKANRIKLLEEWYGECVMVSQRAAVRLWGFGALLEWWRRSYKGQWEDFCAKQGWNLTLVRRARLIHKKWPELQKLVDSGLGVLEARGYVRKPSKSGKSKSGKSKSKSKSGKSTRLEQELPHYRCQVRVTGAWAQVGLPEHHTDWGQDRYVEITLTELVELLSSIATNKMATTDDDDNLSSIEIYPPMAQ
jgi:hypothetical protein